jgi:hypothetical protein
MLDNIRYFWYAFTESKVFPWIVVILGVAVYCNLGWALGYITYHPESFPPWLYFLADPFISVAIGTYTLGMQTVFIFFGVPVFLAQWFFYLIYLIVFGGIAKLLIL